LVPTSGAPEIYVLASIIVFLALSFAAYFSGEYLSGLLPFIYQTIALAGLGEMYVANFVLQTDIKTRASLSYAYLFAAIMNMAWDHTNGHTDGLVLFLNNCSGIYLSILCKGQLKYFNAVFLSLHKWK